MKKHDVMALLETERSEPGIEKWRALGKKTGGLTSFGLGLTRLRKLAKQIGRDHGLALELWASGVYDAKVIALLIDDPKVITREQLESQVEQLKGGYLAHVFSSCGATVAKTPFAVELASDWMESADVMRRDCGYGVLYEISKWKKKSAPDESYFLERIAHIDATIDDEVRGVRLAMGGALMGIGKRSKSLNAAALKVARRVGPIEFGDGSCDPFDVEKHLTSDGLKKKLGV